MSNSTPNNRNFFTPSDESYESFLKDLKEVNESRTKQKSEYSGVYRIHLNDGVVDVRSTKKTLHPEHIIGDSFNISYKKVNGSIIEINKHKFVDWCKNQKISIYDIF